MFTTDTRPVDGQMNNLIDSGRVLDADQLKAQMGRGTMLAISGGRIVWHGPSCVLLPVASGYVVAVIIEANDTYTVRRVLKRGGRFIVKGEVADVYSEQVGEIAYQASCFRDGEFGS